MRRPFINCFNHSFAWSHNLLIESVEPDHCLREMFPRYKKRLLDKL
jgi:hypothetical protein